MNFWKDREIPTSRDLRELDENYEERIELTPLGQKVVSFLNLRNNLLTYDEISYLLDLLNKQEVQSHEAADILNSQRKLLNAQLALIEATFAILPKPHKAYGDRESQLLSQKVKRKRTKSSE